MEYIKEVFAQYNRQCIRVYQAYNAVIAKEAIALQTFGENVNYPLSKANGLPASSTS